MLTILVSVSRLVLAGVALHLGSAIGPACAHCAGGDSDAARSVRQTPAPAAELWPAERPRLEPTHSRQQLAHAIVVRTSPEESGVAPESLGTVDVWYDAGIRNEFAALAVINADGDRVDNRDAAIDRTDQSHVSASVGVLAPGTYTVRYRAMSADGHLVSGAWGFEVRSK
jgi:methionine-rich copper-binding protein CopC